jgi:hypothetical protein
VFNDLSVDARSARWEMERFTDAMKSSLTLDYMTRPFRLDEIADFLDRLPGLPDVGGGP